MCLEGKLDCAGWCYCTKLYHRIKNNTHDKKWQVNGNV